MRRRESAIAAHATHQSPAHIQQRNRAVRKALGLANLVLVTYKSPEQEELALERIMNDTDSALVVVLPTGGGKSLLFIARACLGDPGMTIVIVPYRQLINETLSDATACGIDAVEWTRDLQDPAEIVIVSADKLKTCTALSPTTLVVGKYFDGGPAQVTGLYIGRHGEMRSMPHWSLRLGTVTAKQIKREMHGGRCSGSIANGCPVCSMLGHLSSSQLSASEALAIVGECTTVEPVRDVRRPTSRC
ncbi:hypothetical protein E4U32_006319 [Claviceps aff. humidiphila group G2b]|nr:hypothetical protein E4U32_006319 [Claviceps aff. humidiphila group G2b]